MPDYPPSDEDEEDEQSCSADGDSYDGARWEVYTAGFGLCTICG